MNQKILFIKFVFVVVVVFIFIQVWSVGFQLNEFFFFGLGWVYLGEGVIVDDVGNVSCNFVLIIMFDCSIFFAGAVYIDLDVNISGMFLFGCSLKVDNIVFTVWVSNMYFVVSIND